MDIDFWFDFSCPYCYPAAMMVEDILLHPAQRINWHGFTLGPMLSSQVTESTRAEHNSARLSYLWHDLNRLCAQYDLPFLRPSRPHTHARLATRIVCWYQLEGWLPSLVRALFQAAYAQDRNIADETVVADCLVKVGLNPSKVIAQANSMEARARLQLQNQQAIRQGIFDAPFFFVQQEPFCGLERMEMATDWSYCNSATLKHRSRG